MADERQEEDYIEIKIPSQEPAAESVAPKEEPKQPTENKETPKKVAKKKSSAKKKTTKKTAKKPITPKANPKKKAKRQPSDRQSNNWLWAVLLLIGLVVIAAVIYLSLQQPTDKETTSEDQQVAALVNNQPIYQEELDKIHENLPANMGTIEKDVILEQLIEQELLMQEAAAQGIKISDEELQEYIDELLAYFGVPKDQLDAALEAQDMTVQEFERSSKRQLTVNTLINQTVYSKINITDEAIEARYEEDKELFAVPATATIKHILITARENETVEETEARAEEVMDMINEDNFCELVSNYTSDVASIPTCGEYEIMQNGQYVPEFETAAFDMDVDDTQITQTDFGYHIMWKIAEREAGTLSLEEATTQIEAMLFQEAASAGLAAYVAELRDDAVIEKYPEGTKNAPTTPEEEADVKEPVVEVEKTRPIREGDFGECLADQGAVMYGVSWAPDVESQEELLGEAFEEVTYVDCDPATGDAPAACDDISVYPTWIIGSGEDALVLEGKQSMNALSQETGCQA